MKHGSWMLVLLTMVLKTVTVANTSLLAQNAETPSRMNHVPDFRSKADCGRVAAFLFVNLFKETPFDEIAKWVPIEDAKGSSMKAICDCLSHFEIFHQAKWAKPGELSQLRFPAIVHLRGADHQFHYVVVIQFLAETDHFDVLFGERDDIFRLEGKKLRLQSTGFVIESAEKSNWLAALFSYPWLLIVGAVIAIYICPRFVVSSQSILQRRTRTGQTSTELERSF